jgi:hypothetical protein
MLLTHDDGVAITASPKTASLEIINPVAVAQPDSEEFERFAPAARLDDLAGKTIGLFWNGKPGGGVALERVRENLSARYPGMAFRDFYGAFGPQARHASPAQLEEMAACDAVVGTSADCGSCTSWLVRDMCEVERRGTPAVPIASPIFVEDSHWSAKIFGCPELQLVEVSHPITAQSDDFICGMIDAAMDQLIAGLTGFPYRGQESFAHHVQDAAATLSYSGSDLLDCFDAMNAAFVRSGWSDGMPLIPPTEGKVSAMIEAGGRPRDEIVGIFEPGFGVGTIEKIAANAVMAGCKPETMPVILAMMECVLDRKFGLRTMSMSTGPQAPLIWVSGPYGRDIGMNSGCCALGPASISQVNVSIGRALRLVMMNVGLSYPGVSDMDTIGSAMKFGACVAENEERTPWEPFRMWKGFDRGATTVTVHQPYAVADVTDFSNSTPEAVIKSLSLAAKQGAASAIGNWLVLNPNPEAPGPYHGDYDIPILMAPDHADIFRNAGWSRKDVQEALYKEMRLPFATLMHTKPAEAFRVTHPNLQWLWDQPETEVSMYKSADRIEICVVGAEAPRSLYWYAGGSGVTKPVKAS